MLRLSDIVTYRKVPKGWAELSDRQRMDNYGALIYVAHLANDLAFDVDGWNVLKMFAGEAPGLLITDKGQINQRFFARYDKELAALAELIAPLAAKAAAQVGKLFPDIELRHLSNVDNQIEEAIGDARHAAEDLANAVARVRALVALSESLRGKTFDLGAEVARIVSECPFLSFKGVLDHHILFHTTTDLVLTEKVPSAGLNITVCLGRFTLLLDPLAARLWLNARENNVFVTGIYHPFVGRNGDICFGSGTDMINAALSEGRFTDAIKDAWAVLTRYTPDNPYVALVHMKAEQDRQLAKQHVEAGVVPAPARNVGPEARAIEELAAIIREAGEGAAVADVNAGRLYGIDPQNYAQAVRVSEDRLQEVYLQRQREITHGPDGLEAWRGRPPEAPRGVRRGFNYVTNQAAELNFAALANTQDAAGPEYEIRLEPNGQVAANVVPRPPPPIPRPDFDEEF